jgi:hypothetical protein
VIQGSGHELLVGDFVLFYLIMLLQRLIGLRIQYSYAILIVCIEGGDSMPPPIIRFIAYGCQFVHHERAKLLKLHPEFTHGNHVNEVGYDIGLVMYQPPRDYDSGYGDGQLLGAIPTYGGVDQDDVGIDEFEYEYLQDVGEESFRLIHMVLILYH